MEDESDGCGDVYDQASEGDNEMILKFGGSTCMLKYTNTRCAFKTCLRELSKYQSKVSLYFETS